MNKQWFIDRIGQRIYRNTGTCECAICESARKNGLVIEDETHADYLHAMQSETEIEYRDEQ